MWFLLTTALAGLPTSLPALEAELAPGTDIRGTLGAQLRIDTTFDGKATPSASLTRLRTGLRIRTLQRRLRLQTQLNLVPGKLELIDLFIEGDTGPAYIRLGWSKIPLSRYRETSVFELASVDWDQSARVLGGERQLGLSIHDDWGGGIDWAIGVFTGANSRAAHGLGLAKAHGIAVSNPSSLVDPPTDLVFHPELVARLGWSTPGMQPTRHLGQGHDTVEVAVHVGGAFDIRPDPQQDYAARLVPEVALQWRRLWVDILAPLGFIATREHPATLAHASLLTEFGVRAHRYVDLYGRVSYLHESAALQETLGQAEDRYLRHRHGLHLGAGVAVPVVGSALEWSSDVMWEGATTAGGRVVLRTQLQVKL